MKSKLVILSSLVGLFLVTTGAERAGAAPRATEASGAHYLLAAENLHVLHLGGYYRYADRQLNHGSAKLKQNKYMGSLGMDLLSWVTVYGVLGVETTKIEPSFSGASDTSMEYGGGLWANLLDHDLMDNLNLESRLRLQALGQVTASRPEVEGRKLSYVEYYGALTLSVVNEVVGHKGYWPEAIGLFFGPVYNKVDSSDLKTTGSKFGLTTGLDFHLTRATTLSFSYEYFNEDKVLNTALNFRF